MRPLAPLLPLLHPAAAIGWTSWTIHWSTVVGLAALGGLYAWRLRARDGRMEGGRDAEPLMPPSLHPSIPRTAAFAAGLLAIFAALNGPLHDLSDYYLFSAHMVQHLVLTLVAPPLLLYGTPGWMLRPLLRVPAVGAAARQLTRPAACFAIFNVVVAAWHLPPLYNTAMAHHGVHVLQHLMFLGAAVLMWWPFLSPLPELPRPSYPVQMLYCFLMSIPMSVVSIYIAYADRVLYPAYSSAPRVWGLSPMEDQLVGGLIMWIPGGLFFYGVMTVVFFKWAAHGTDDAPAAHVREPVIAG